MPRRQDHASPLVVLIAAVAVVAALYFAKAILLPLALAILLAFLLTPLANRVERWGLPRIPAVLVVGGLSFAVIGVLIWIVAIQAVDLGSKSDLISANLTKKVASIGGEKSPVGRFLKTFDRLRARLAEETMPKSGNGTPTDAPTETDPATASDAVEVKVVDTSSPLTQIGEWLGQLVAPLPTAGMVVVLVLFLLIEREDQRNRIIELFGTSNLNLTTEALTDAGRRVSRFLRMQFMINAGYGCCVAVALFVLGVPGAIMWGVLGFMLRFLPYVGPILGSALPIGVSLAVSPGWTQPLLVLGWFVVLELILNNVVEPWLYGNTIGVSAVGIIVSAIFWTWLWGPVGLLLAMPLTVCLLVVSRYVPQLRFVSVLLSDEPAMSPAEQTYQRLLAMDDHEIERIAKQQIKSGELVAYYDDVLIPALSLAERDREAGHLTDDQEAFIEEATDDLIETIAEAGAKKVPEEAEDVASLPAEVPSRPAARVLCIPLRDQADTATTAILAQLLAAEGLFVDVASVDSLTNELVDEVARLKTQIAVISILPPCSPRNSRLLCRRLRRSYPQLPIIIGYWNALPTEKLEQRFELGENDKLVTRLADAVEAVRASASRLVHLDNQAAGDDEPASTGPVPAMAAE